MHVLLVNARGDDLRHGGAERSVALLRDGLIRRGHRVTTLASYPGDGADASHLTRRDRDPHDAPTRRIADHVDGWVAGVPRDLEPALQGVDVVHTHNLPGIWTGIWELARRRAVPVVHTLHDYGLLCARSSLVRRDGSPCCAHPRLCDLRRRRLRRWAGSVDAVVGVSRHVLTRHAAVFPRRCAPFVIAPPRLPPVAGAGSPPRRLRKLGYVGALTPEKGVAVLLSVAPELELAGVSLQIAGGGPLAHRVRGGPVGYVGRLDAAGRDHFMAECDAGVVCSTWEEPAVNFAAREWLAARRPLIASDRGALAELSGTDGVLSYDATPTGLLDAVRIATSPSGWTDLTGSLTRRRESSGGVEDWIDAHLDVYTRAALGDAT